MGQGDTDPGKKPGDKGKPQPGPTAEKLAAGGPKKVPVPKASRSDSVEDKAGGDKPEGDPSAKGDKAGEKATASGAGKAPSEAKRDVQPSEAARVPGGSSPGASGSIGSSPEPRTPAGAVGSGGRAAPVEAPLDDLNATERAAVQRLQQAIRRIQTNRDRHSVKPAEPKDEAIDLNRRRDW
jgi:hypothetical protein